MTRPRHSPALDRLARFAWLPVPVLIAAIAAFWAADLRTPYASPIVLKACNFLFLTAGAAVVAVLAGRSFLASGDPALLLLGCGVIFWAFGGTVGSVLLDHGVNATVTVHNTLMWLAALCHLVGVILYRKQRLTVPLPGLPLALAYSGTLCVICLVATLTHSGLTPVFFVQGEGGTPMRQVLLGSAIAAFAFTAVVLRRANQPDSPSAFARWYAAALALLATGLLGIMIQPVFDGVLSWTGRLAQYLGGIYLLAAAAASIRESGARGISLPAALRAARRNFNELFDLAADGIAICQLTASTRPQGGPASPSPDAEPAMSRFLQTNAALCQLLGRTHAEMRELTPLDIIPPGDRTIVPQLLDRLLRDGIMRHEQTLVTSDGRHIPCELITRVFTQYGRRMIISVIRDVTDRKRAEEAARQSADTFEKIFHGNASAMALTRLADGCILDVNDSWLERMGMRRCDVLGKGMLELGLWQSPAQRAAMIQEVTANGSVREREYTCRLPGGQEWIALFSAQCITVRGERLLISSAIDITERKRAEEALRESEERLRLALHAGSMATWDWHIPSGRTVWNDEHFRMLGYAVGEVTPGYSAWAERLHPDDAAATETALRRCMEMGSDYSAEYRVRTPDGTVRWLESRGRFERDAGGRPLRSYGVMLNITDRKQAEAELQDLTQHLTYHVENSPLAVIEWDGEMRLIRWAGEAEHIFGWKAEEVLGKRMHDFRWVYEEDASHVTAVSDELMSGANTRGFSSNRNYRKDGSVVQCEWYNSSLVDESGRLRSILSLVLDVTERTRAEQALHASHAAALNLMEDAVEARKQAEQASANLRRSQEQLALAATGTGIGMFDRDIATGEILATRQHIRLMGLRQTPVAGATTMLSQSYRYADWAAQVHPEDLLQVEEDFNRCMRMSTSYESEYRVIWPDGSVHWIATRGVFQYDARGQPSHLLGIASDITTRKRAEEALRRTAEDLSRSNKDLEQFAYVTSHDLKEPLRMVTGFLSLLKERYEDRLDAKANEYIGFAFDAASRMQGMVDDLLTYSRAGSEKEREPIDATAALDAALKHLQAAIAESGAVVTHDPLPPVHANTLELTQVFQNLIGNAIKFRKPGAECLVHVSAERVRDALPASRERPAAEPAGATGPCPPAPRVKSGAFQMFSVRDNGIGIDPQFADRIFLIFQRLHTREEYPGTGVGLAICKKIVERYGGSIWVESREGAGSTFLFTLPE